MTTEYSSAFQAPQKRTQGSSPNSNSPSRNSPNKASPLSRSSLNASPFSNSALPPTPSTVSKQVELDHKLALQAHADELEKLDHDSINLVFPEPANPLIGNLMFPGLPEFTRQASIRDQAVSQRLGTFASQRLTPRVNSGILPDSLFVSEDRQRLKLRLEMYDLVEREVAGDGNCQFRALSDQLYGSTDHWDTVRKAVVQQLKKHPDMYQPYVPTEYNEYVTGMAKSGTWGDHVTLKAAADVYGVRISIITSYKENAVLDIQPDKATSQRVLWLSFWAEVHYNSLVPR